MGCESRSAPASREPLPRIRRGPLFAFGPDTRSLGSHGIPVLFLGPASWSVPLFAGAGGVRPGEQGLPWGILV